MLWKFTAKYSTDGGSTFTTISNLQNVTIEAGRQALVDNFSASRCSLTFRYPNGFASPLTDLLPGAYLYVTAETTTGGYPFDAYYGYITDVSVQYGIPYQGSVGNADYLNITAEGGFAKFARASGNEYAMAAGAVTTQLATASTQSGVSVDTPQVSYYSAQNASGAVVSGSWGDWLTQMAFTFGGRISDGLGCRLLSYQPIADYSTNASFYLSDTGTGLPYDQIGVDSLAQNYFTQVTVDPYSYANQTVSTGSAPYRNYTLNTWSASDGQATDLATWYLKNFDNPQLAISELHVNLNNPATNPIRDFFVSASSGVTTGAFPIGVQIKVLFRGQTYVCVIEGGSLSSTPAQTSLTLYVTSADLNAFLLLGNPTFGQLDYNRLGF